MPDLTQSESSDCGRNGAIGAIGQRLQVGQPAISDVSSEDSEDKLFCVKIWIGVDWFTSTDGLVTNARH